MQRYIGHGFIRDAHDQDRTRIVTLRGPSRESVERRARRLLKLSGWEGYCLALYPLTDEQLMDTGHTSLYTPGKGQWRPM